MSSPNRCLPLVLIDCRGVIVQEMFSPPVLIKLTDEGCYLSIFTYKVQAGFQQKWVWSGKFSHSCFLDLLSLSMVPSLECEAADWCGAVSSHAKHFDSVVMDSDDVFALHNFVRSLKH